MIKAAETEEERARQNRELVKAGLGNKFHDRQARMASRWQFGTPKPKSLIVAEEDPASLPPLYPFGGGQKGVSGFED